RCWIRVVLTDHFSHAYNGLLFTCVVEKRQVTLFHRAQMIAGRKIAHPIPAALLLLGEAFPGVLFRFGFEQPVIASHVIYSSVLSTQLVHSNSFTQLVHSTVHLPGYSAALAPIRRPARYSTRKTVA